MAFGGISNLNGLALQQGLAATDFRTAQSTQLTSSLFAARSSANVFVAAGQNFTPFGVQSFSGQMLQAFQGLGNQWSGLLGASSGVGLGAVWGGVGGPGMGPTFPAPLANINFFNSGVGAGFVFGGVGGPGRGPSFPAPLPNLNSGVGLGAVFGGVGGPGMGPTFPVPLGSPFGGFGGPFFPW